MSEFLTKEIGGQRVVCGNNLEVLPGLADCSVDLVLTDPPYGISFMGKEWDKALPDPATWVECLRVLKPGGSAVVMSGARLDCLWRMCRDLEEAGFELEQTAFFWCYRSGFPKGGDLSKMADARAMVPCPECGGKTATLNRETGQWGVYDPDTDTWSDLCKRCGGKGSVRGAEREVVGKTRRCVGPSQIDSPYFGSAADWANSNNATAPATDLARDLDGWFTKGKVKPAVEVIIWARKPTSERTELDNMVRHGVGGVNCGACMVPGNDTVGWEGRRGFQNSHNAALYGGLADGQPNPSVSRFPANLLVTDEALGPEDSRYFDLDAWAREHGYSEDWADAAEAGLLQVAKPSAREKRAGLDGIEQVCYDEATEGGSSWASTDQSQNTLQAEDTSPPKDTTESQSGTQSPSLRDTSLSTFACGKNPMDLFLQDIPSTMSTETPETTGLKTCSSSPSLNTRGYTGGAIATKQEPGSSHVPSAEPCTPSRRASTSGQTESDLGASSVASATPSRTSGSVKPVGHPTTKPITLFAYLISFLTKPGATVLDPFLGSGTTLVAAAATGRDGIGIELEEDYCAIAEARVRHAVAQAEEKRRGNWGSLPEADL